jgi:hypothetical protein
MSNLFRQARSMQIMSCGVKTSKRSVHADLPDHDGARPAVKR